MRRYEGKMNGERFLGDARAWRVHDLDRETDACQIDRLLEEGCVTPFDNRVDALLDGYDPCEACRQETVDLPRDVGLYHGPRTIGFPA